MLILAMESSAKAASVAVTYGSVLLGQYFQNSGLTHSKTLMAMTESLLKNLSLQPSDIELVAVAAGPGSFTGVRIGVAAAKGFAWGANIPVCGVSTLEAMAYQTQEQGVLICPVMDARRDQVYNALFEWQNGSPTRLCEDRAISLSELSSDFKNYERQCLLIGDGADIAYTHLHCENITVKVVGDLIKHQTAYGVALAATASKPVGVTELEPFYLRPSQAERESGGKS